MPSKSAIGKGLIRFAAIYAMSFALILQATNAKDSTALVAAVIPALIMAVEKVFLPI